MLFCKKEENEESIYLPAYSRFPNLIDIGLMTNDFFF